MSDNIRYQVHCQSIGDSNIMADGSIAGTTGKSLRLEAIRIASRIDGIKVEIRAHCQVDGWQDWKNENEWAGTQGQSKRLEAVQIRLTGVNSDKYSVIYRLHLQSYGWLNWAKDGETSGSVGQGIRSEAIQIQIIGKEEPIPAANPACDFNYKCVEIPVLTAQAHVQNVGWMAITGQDSNGIVTIGTTGRSLSMEAFKINIDDKSQGFSILGEAQIQNLGWCGAQTASMEIGTTGQSLRLEAVRLDLVGKYAGMYKLWYRAHCQNRGWMGWQSDGQNVGTEGASLRLEALQICILPAGNPAPGDTSNGFWKFVPPPAPAPAPFPADVDYRGSMCAIASGEVGTEEEPNGWTKYGQWYQDTFAAPGFSCGEWCDMLYSWCANQAGAPREKVGFYAYCPSHVNFFDSMGRKMSAYGDYSPQPGDAVFFNWDQNPSGEAMHIGMVVDFDGSTITTIEGNTGSGTPSVCVKQWDYTSDYIIWYGSPNF